MSLARNIATVLRQGFAFGEKDLKLSFRFKVYFFVNVFSGPLINIGLFGTVFLGFLGASGNTTYSGVSGSNFVSFVILGALASTIFNQTSNMFPTKFQGEKYWQTISGLLASPLSPWALVIGAGISQLVNLSVVIIFFVTLAYIFFPASLIAVIGSLYFLALLYATVAGLSLINGAIFLVNENATPIINYILLGTGYLSCFFFPLSFVPSILRPFAMINPIYFSVYSMRALWIGQPLNIYYLILAPVIAILSVSISTFVFTRIWRNLDTTGY